MNIFGKLTALHRIVRIVGLLLVIIMPFVMELTYWRCLIVGFGSGIWLVGFSLKIMLSDFTRT